jgi:hypothetical protein
MLTTPSDLAASGDLVLRVAQTNLDRNAIGIPRAWRASRNGSSERGLEHDPAAALREDGRRLIWLRGCPLCR